MCRVPGRWLRARPGRTAERARRTWVTMACSLHWRRPVKLFSCQKCAQVLFFENTVCTQCGQPVAYSVEAASLVSTPRDESKAAQPFKVKLPNGKRALFSKCKNFTEHDACNWLVAEADHDPYCRSCRLTEPNPSLSGEQDRTAWIEIERA